MPTSFSFAPAPTNVPNIVLDQNNLIIAEPNVITRVTVTAAQLLALKTTPLLLVPPPGLGLALKVSSMALKLLFATTAYTLNAGTLRLFIGTVANAVPIIPDQSAILTQVASKIVLGIPTVTSGVQNVALIENQGIFLGNDGTANYTLGDSPLNVILNHLVYQT
jgi:hypothetical protein